MSWNEQPIAAGAAGAAAAAPPPAHSATAGIPVRASNIKVCQDKCQFADGGYVIYCQHCGYQVPKIVPPEGITIQTSSDPMAMGGEERGQWENKKEHGTRFVPDA